MADGQRQKAAHPQRTTNGWRYGSMTFLFSLRPQQGGWFTTVCLDSRDSLVLLRQTLLGRTQISETRARPGETAASEAHRQRGPAAASTKRARRSCVQLISVSGLFLHRKPRSRGSCLEWFLEAHHHHLCRQGRWWTVFDWILTGLNWARDAHSTFAVAHACPIRPGA